VPIETLRLAACPRCEYSLTGLPAAHRCPECGFDYDDRAFVLSGIARGTTSMKPERKLLWVVLAAMTWFSPMLVAALFPAAGSIVCLAFAGLCLAILVYLVATGKHERRGNEKFLFSAGGFGYCAAVTQTGIADARMTAWADVDALVVERKGATWHRIRIGRGRRRDGRPKHVRFDIGVRCSEAAAAWICMVLEQRIRDARARARESASNQLPAGN
jgi:hypothetical protein